MTQLEHSSLLDAVRADRHAALNARTRDAFVDLIFSVERGSFVGRTLEQYRHILCHAGAPTPEDIIERFEGNACPVLDMGGGAGFALADLKTAYPGIEPHLSDIRNTPLNKEKHTKQPMAIMHRKHSIIFHQKSHLQLVRDPQLQNRFGLITCVFAAHDDDSGGILLPYFLKRTRNLLQEEGAALIFTAISPTLQECTEQILTQERVNFHFYRGNDEVLQMAHDDQIRGTFVIDH